MIKESLLRLKCIISPGAVAAIFLLCKDHGPSLWSERIKRTIDPFFFVGLINHMVRAELASLMESLLLKLSSLQIFERFYQTILSINLQSSVQLFLRQLNHLDYDRKLVEFLLTQHQLFCFIQPTSTDIGRGIHSGSFLSHPLFKIPLHLWKMIVKMRIQKSPSLLYHLPCLSMEVDSYSA